MSLWIITSSFLTYISVLSTLFSPAKYKFWHVWSKKGAGSEERRWWEGFDGTGYFIWHRWKLYVGRVLLAPTTGKHGLSQLDFHDLNRYSLNYPRLKSCTSRMTKRWFSGPRSRKVQLFLSAIIIGLPGDSLRNTGHLQCQCRWHKILSDWHMHCPVLGYYHFYAGQRAKIPDSPVKSSIDGDLDNAECPNWQDIWLGSPSCLPFGEPLWRKKAFVTKMMLYVSEQFVSSSGERRAQWKTRENSATFRIDVYEFLRSKQIVWL